MDTNARRAGQRYENRRSRFTIADPICPICRRARVPNYQMMLQASPHLALRGVERSLRLHGHGSAHGTGQASRTHGDIATINRRRA